MQDSFITIDGTKIRYCDNGGSGPVALLLHGIGGSVEMWNRQMEAAMPLRLIALDLPGHGLSDISRQPNDPDSFAATVVQFANALGLDRFALVGNSMGGGIAFRVAGLMPAHVSHVIALNAATLGRDAFFPFRLMTLPILGEVMTRPSQVGIDRMISGVFKDPATSVTQDISAAMARNQFKPGGATALLTTLRRMTDLGGQRRDMTAKSHDLIRQMHAPLLFVHGHDDAIIPAHHSKAAAALNPTASLELLDDCGHMPMIEKPARINTLITAFVGT